MRTSPNSLIAMLRGLRVGESGVIPGKTAAKLSNYTRAARLGTQKWFQCKTLTSGARVWRLE